MRRSIVVVFLLVAATVGFAQTAKPVPVTPTITYLEGSVSVDGKDAAIGDIVPLGSVVRTGQGAVAEIAFNGRNAVRLAESTTLLFNPGNLQSGSELRQGALTLVLKKLVAGAGGESFIVRTPSAVAGVRGTSFFLKVESPASTYVCACNGAVSVLGTDGTPLRELASAHHSGLHIEGTGGQPKLTEAGLLYHTDSDLQQVAADVGVAIDWSTIDR
ncbi:MAG TPA: FecR family protein [Spirochaetia bacterium]